MNADGLYITRLEKAKTYTINCNYYIPTSLDATLMVNTIGKKDNVAKNIVQLEVFFFF